MLQVLSSAFEWCLLNRRLEVRILSAQAGSAVSVAESVHGTAHRDAPARLFGSCPDLRRAADTTHPVFIFELLQQRVILPICLCRRRSPHSIRTLLGLMQ